MDLHRTSTILDVDDPTTGHDFFRSPSNRGLQVSLVGKDRTAPEQSAMSVGHAH